MPSSQPWLVLTAAVIGAIGAASMFLIEHIRQERRRHGMAQDLARMDQQLSMLRREMDQLRLPKDKNEKNPRRSKRKQPSVVSTITSDEYRSVGDIDSSDLEFYDLSDEDVTRASASVPLDTVLNEIDKKLESGKTNDIRYCLDKLNDLCIEHPENPDLLWRIGKAHYNMASTCANDNEKLDNINKGIDACSGALRLNAHMAEVHKWYAILVGSRGGFQSTADRISDGHVFKKHVDRAVELNPTDPSLHHLLGRFAYEVAGLKWYERKVAATFYGEPPNATYQEALSHLMTAEDLSQDGWKENKLLIGKCHIAAGDPRAGVQWLTQAGDMASANDIEEQLDAEIRTLLSKYNTYR